MAVDKGDYSDFMDASDAVARQRNADGGITNSYTKFLLHIVSKFLRKQFRVLQTVLPKAA